MKLLSLAAALLLCASFAHADTLSEWNVSASGYFGGNGQPAETFLAHFTVEYADDSPIAPGLLLPLWTGTMQFSGLLGNFTANYQDAPPAQAEGYLAAIDNYGDEIDFVALPYPWGPFGWDPHSPPELFGTPYLYGCVDPVICAAYGTQVGIGLFSGSGKITETVTRVATPEPATLLLLAASLPFIVSMRNRRRAAGVCHIA